MNLHFEGGKTFKTLSIKNMWGAWLLDHANNHEMLEKFDKELYR